MHNGNPKKSSLNKLHFLKQQKRVRPWKTNQIFPKRKFWDHFPSINLSGATLLLLSGRVKFFSFYWMKTTHWESSTLQLHAVAGGSDPIRTRESHKIPMVSTVSPDRSLVVTSGSSLQPFIASQGGSISPKLFTHKHVVSIRCWCT